MFNRFFITLIVIICFFVAQNSDAATLSLTPSTSSVTVGNIVSISVKVNTQGKYINNSEAIIQFPTDLLEVVSISKNSSIFSLWVEEPSFSNTKGQITFNGGIANPGFNGSNGTLAVVTFKAKKAGSASVIYGDSAIRENDGLGTNILNNKISSVVSITSSSDVAVAPTNPSETGANTVPIKPTIISSTHPDQDSWYSLDTASFNWKVPSGINQIQATLNKVATATPSISYDNSVTQKTLSNLSDGVYYFHLRYQNSIGWSPSAHYKISVDNTTPLDFEPKIRTEDNQNILKLNAEDTMSGISHYVLTIDDSEPFKVKKSELIDEEYILPILNQGDHSLLISAYDKAGNYKDSKLEFKSSFISVPTISLSSEEINKGEAVVVLGKTDYPNNKVLVTLSFEGEVLKNYIQTTDADGSFSLTTDRIKKIGLVDISAENIFSNDVKSRPSKTVILKINEPVVIKVTFALLWVILFLILVTILLFIAYEGWHKFLGLKKKINNELEKVKEDAHKGMLLLKEELNDQLSILEKTKVDRVLNKKEEIIFKGIQKNVDDIDEFIEKKLKKMM